MALRSWTALNYAPSLPAVKANERSATRANEDRLLPLPLLWRTGARPYLRRAKTEETEEELNRMVTDGDHDRPDRIGRGGFLSS